MVEWKKQLSIILLAKYSMIMLAQGFVWLLDYKAHTSDQLYRRLIGWMESHFLGHTIGIMWPINNLYTTMTRLPFIHCDDINWSSWPKKLEVLTNKEPNNQSKSIIGLRHTHTHTHTNRFPFFRTAAAEQQVLRKVGSDHKLRYPVQGIRRESLPPINNNQKRQSNTLHATGQCHPIT